MVRSVPATHLATSPDFAAARSVRRPWAVAVLLAGLALPMAVHAQAARYELDPVHTRVMFEISHAGYSQAIGTVSGSTGTLVFDPEDWTSARVEVSVPLSRLDLGDAKWNRAALGRNLLDGDGHPLATFTSTRVEPVDATHAHVVGTLTLHGVAREVVLEVAFNQLKRYPLPPFRRTAGFSATTTISRKAFGIDAWPTVIGDAVTLRIEAEARRVHGDAGLDAAQDETRDETPETKNPDATVPDAVPPDAAIPEETSADEDPAQPPLQEPTP